MGEFTDMYNIIPKPSDFHISEEVGFLLPDALESLPEYFKPWGDIADNLECLTEMKTVRKHVEQLPLLDYTRLQGHREYRLAHVQLAFTAAAYVWQDGDNDPAKVLPKCISVPLCGVSKHLGLPPLVCHPSVMLANWRKINPQGNLDIENLYCICKVTASQQISWFLLTTCLVELAFARGLPDMLDAFKMVVENNEEKLITCLDNMVDTLNEMKRSVARMHEKLEPPVFYNKIRPFLSGWGNGSKTLPDGLIYEGVSPIPQAYIGGSAAQSAVLHCYDAALGIAHDKDKQSFLDDMLNYMLPPHRAFVQCLRQAPSIKHFVHSSNSEALTSAYDNCVKVLAEFRSYHINLVARYIVCAAQEARNRDHASLSDTGTGGTAIMPFLKSIRDSTNFSQINSN
ncbi:unnamed protein product [Owenia fusiformis]|uniref:Indoleamine 2,3-dioxygenase n=1 Tax=Owenia fusiformis TaxID=6347 RepID=A0A8S4NHP3_OWEFU|nr:unnamed protein product [Owenia fusiformis]